MVFGQGSIPRFQDYRLDVRGVMLAKRRGDIELAALLLSPQQQTNATARRVRPPHVPAERCKKDESPLPPVHPTEQNKRLDSAQLRRLLLSLVPAPPSPAVDRPYRALSAPARDEKFVSKFYEQGIKRHQAAVQAAEAKHAPRPPTAKRLTSKSAVDACVEVLHYSAIKTRELHRNQLQQKYLKSPLSMYTACLLFKSVMELARPSAYPLALKK
jgi:hypothetical protein